MRESKELIQQIKDTAATCLVHRPSVVTDWQSLRKKLESAIEKLIFKTTERRPLLLTVIIEV